MSNTATISPPNPPVSLAVTGTADPNTGNDKRVTVGPKLSLAVIFSGISGTMSPSSGGSELDDSVVFSDDSVTFSNINSLSFEGQYQNSEGTFNDYNVTVTPNSSQTAWTVNCYDINNNISATMTVSLIPPPEK